MNIAVLVSGNGSNLQALIDAEKRGEFPKSKITLVISDNPDAHALKRAEKAGIDRFVVIAKNFASTEAFDEAIIKKIEEKKIDLLVLAGFMRILGDKFVDKYYGRMLNIHPALLPAFKGAHGVRDAFESGARTTGVTVHFVTKELDSGPIISQESVNIDHGDTIDSLEKKIHAVEHRLYPEVVRLFCEEKLKIEGEKVKICRRKSKI